MAITGISSPILAWFEAQGAPISGNRIKMENLSFEAIQHVQFPGEEGWRCSLCHEF